MEGSEDFIFSQKKADFEKVTIEPVGMLPKGKDSSLTCYRFLSDFLIFTIL